MDATLALLEVDGVGGEVPVIDGVAIGVEVEAFLSDGRGGEDKRAEGAIEGFADGLGAGEGGGLVVLEVAEPERESAAKPERGDLHAARACGDLVDGEAAAAWRERGVDLVRDLARHVDSGPGDHASALDEVMGVLVEHGLEVAVDAVGEDASPVGQAVVVVVRAEQAHRLGDVEEDARAPRRT